MNVACIFCEQMSMGTLEIYAIFAHYVNFGMLTGGNYNNTFRDISFYSELNAINCKFDMKKDVIKMLLYSVYGM